MRSARNRARHVRLIRVCPRECKPPTVPLLGENALASVTDPFHRAGRGA